ncbi:MAG: sulfatase-like hydrolase/transferase [Holophagales bacterium]|nr:sulfatase-like hydrolase/transferase [Holophagales bacterium]MYD23976.1 sulfatase-like hydrolase/transferase [Holophagales bacterium]MYI33471.1 sulfatase-like hydrolase/transferase [Holophagales bacterium]
MAERAGAAPFVRGLLVACSRDLTAGLLFGALLFGGPISLAHLVHNRTDSAVAGVAALLLFALLYGIWAGAAFGGLGLLLRTLARLRRRPAGNPVVLAACLFNLVFLELVLFYGLTYGQIPWFTPAGFWSMALFLAVAGVLAGAAIWIVTRALGARVARLADGLLPRLVGGLALALVAVHVVLPIAFRLAPEERTASFDPTALVAADGPPVALLGFDGVDPDMLQDLIDDGELPNLAEFVREGTSSRLETISDANSAVIWASIYTGETPRRHGVHDFYRIRFPGSGAGLFPVHRTSFKELIDLVARAPGISRRFVNRLDLASPPIWEIADRAGLPTVVVDGYFYSFPAQRMLEPSSRLLGYGLNDTQAAAGGADTTLEWFAQPPDVPQEVLDAAAGRPDLDWQHRAVIALLEHRSRQGEPPPRFLNLYTHEPDTISHQRWRWAEPELFPFVSRAGIEEHGEAVADVYRRIDGLVGELRRALGPETVFVVASDHGQSPTFVHRLYTQHRHGPDGVLLMYGPGIRRGHRLESSHVLDVFPTMLALLGLPLPEDAEGRVLDGAFESPPDPGSSRRVATYRDAWQPVDTVGGTDVERTRQEIERLKAMGYL